MGCLARLDIMFQKKSLNQSIYAIFSSHMMYGCQVWGQGGVHFEKIIKLQNRALRIINFEDYHVNASPLYAREGILKLIDVIKLQNCLFVHDYLNNAIPLCFDDYYFKLNYLYFNVQTRNSNLGSLFSPSKNTSRYSLNSITQRSINVWNSITKNTKTDLSNLSRHKIKELLTLHFLNLYS